MHGSSQDEIGTCVGNKCLHCGLDVGEFEDFLVRVRLEDHAEDKLSLMTMSAVGIPFSSKTQH